MKKILVLLLVLLIAGMLLSGCSSEATSDQPQTVTPIEEPADSDSQNTDASDDSEPVKSAPDGDIVDGALTTKEEPVPLGTWASVTVSEGGWPKSAYARISSVITDQTEVQILIDEYNNNNSSDEIPALEEHAEFLDYVVVEYEVYFPDDFSDSDYITFYGLVFSRENNQDFWIASDGSNYYWMGSVSTIDTPSEETGYPENGDTVKGKVVYPMIKDNTDYTLHYEERTEDLSAEIDIYFAVE